ncbi:SDR family oxidoreductase [Salibacterium halotolerans]|uniref:NADP-dependent 3-hydroxy acid dehydrogenase YdfG n=1 Tax=Salibacterium halotolerans TaxID=1884432 RepID=A0A1I5W942_9BACI|nr:SDR family oxidoreductase [Salibacterium halotolerans]SFQ15786.1 NADP-dependent 3-hydroxy acid dehydrogenase YdfG [Salibacterium halotolerans]
MSNLKDKVVLMTGASSGIGEGTAKELSDNGAKLVLAARREERLQELTDEINQNGGDAVYKVTDVTSREQLQELAQKALDQYGRIDVLVNNAGLMPLSFMDKLKIDEWDKMVDVNIKGVLYGVAAVLPTMREQKAGHIINISSVAGHTVGPGMSVYSGTKHAVRTITEGLRQEEALAESNIRTTIISPGAVATELQETITDEDVLQGLKSSNMTPIQSKDIASTIRYAIEQPEEVAINEILVRPTSQQG